MNTAKQLMYDRMFLLVLAVSAVTALIFDKFVYVMIMFIVSVAAAAAIGGLFWSLYCEYRDEGEVDVKGFLSSRKSRETPEEAEEA